MCFSKDEGGLGFRNFAKFNIALLAKHGWPLLNNPVSLLTQVLKAKYHPSYDFLNSCCKVGASYTWHNIWAAKKVLQDKLCWMVGKGDCISLFEHAWILGSHNYRLSILVSNSSLMLAADIIDHILRNWKTKLICNTFHEEDTRRILRILLVVVPHEDELTWYLLGKECLQITTRELLQSYPHRITNHLSNLLQTSMEFTTAC